MEMRDKYRQALEDINKIILLGALPICMSFFTLLLYEYVFKTIYTPNKKIFIFKLGIVDTPPSIKYIYEDFPSLLFSYNNQSGHSGIINSLSLLNVFLILSFILLNSFLRAGYLACIKKAGRENVNIKDFFIEGNRHWFKFFILNLVQFTPIIFMLFNKSFIIFGFLVVILYYVEFSIVIDETSLRDNFKKGISFLFDNLWLTIKIMFYCGLIFSGFSFVLFPLGSLGKIGILVAMIIVTYFGMGFNKLVIEVYGESVNTNESCGS